MATRKVSATGVDKLVKDVQAIGEPTDRIAAATFAIARLREAVSTLAADRQAVAVKAHEDGVSYADLARAAEMTTGRMAAIAAGRGQYVRKGEEPKPNGAAKKAAAKKAAPARKRASKASRGTAMNAEAAEKAAAPSAARKSKAGTRTARVK